MTEPSWGYLRLVSKAGPTGVGVPCRYLVEPAFGGGVYINYGVPPEHRDAAWKITSRSAVNFRHTLAIFTVEPPRMLAVPMSTFHCAGADGTFRILWGHRDPDGWWVTPFWPGAARIPEPTPTYSKGWVYA